MNNKFFRTKKLSLMNTLINPFKENAMKINIYLCVDKPFVKKVENDKPFSVRWKMINPHPYHDKPFSVRWKMSNSHPYHDKPFVGQWRYISS